MIQEIKLQDITSNPGPLGLFGFALTTILLNIHNAGFYGVTAMIMGMGIFFGGFAQLLAGIMEGKEEFLEAGGENFTYIPCLNDRQDWIDVLVKWLKGWQNN